MSVILCDEKIYRCLIGRVWRDILNWGTVYMRSYPWRDNPDDYKILIAEIMLHRTKADQVKPVYESFIRKFPDFKSIIDAGPEKIRLELSPLGLAWRTDLLYAMAKNIMEKYQGNIPLSKNKLMELPGVGQYIASAILCFGHDQLEPVLDTNTVRVIGRIFGIKITDSSRRSRKFKMIMLDLISCGKPRRFSLSLIDFAALVCTSKDPKCSLCPLRDICCYYKNSFK